MPNYDAMTQEDFDRILLDVLESTPAPTLLAIPRVYEAVAAHFNNAVIDAWAAEQTDPDGDDWNSRIDEMEAQIADYIHATRGRDAVTVSYSAFDKDRNDLPMNNLLRIAVGGAVVFVADQWFTSTFGAYRSPVMDNPTWLEVAALCDDMLAPTRGQKDHVFFEGFKRVGSEDNGTVKVYQFTMGA